MKICYFGIYNPSYSRNKILISGLKMNGVEVIECWSDKKGLNKYADLIKKHSAIRGNYDAMVVGYPGFQCVILAKFLTRKPIIFDAFVSLYDSMVFDRKQANRFSPKALYYWILDKISLSLSDMALFDTYEHVKYASNKFGIKENKLRRVFLGADTSMFYPKEASQKNQCFKIVFYGHYIPLQGVQYILESVKILSSHKDICFEIIGDGPKKEKFVEMSRLAKLENVKFFGEMPLAELAGKIAEADVCLGIFGNTEKAARVIPNKVYQYAAMKKPIITADTLALRELFDPEEILMVKISDPQSIAEAILYFKANPEIAKSFGDRAYNKFISNALPEKSGLELKNIVKEIL